MRAINLVSISLVMITVLVTDANAASNAWCAVYSKRGTENCGYATLDQCRAQVLGLGGLVPTESVSRDGVWNRWHLVVRPTAPESARVLEVGVRPIGVQKLALSGGLRCARPVQRTGQLSPIRTVRPTVTQLAPSPVRLRP
jgi:hypothetical protein